MTDTLTTLTAVAYPATVTSDGLIVLFMTATNVSGGDTLSSFSVTVDNSSVPIIEGPSSLSIPQGQTISSVLIVNASSLGTVSYQITAQSSLLGTISSNLTSVVVGTNSVQPNVISSGSNQKSKKIGWVILTLLLIMGAVGVVFCRRSRHCKSQKGCAAI